VAIHEQLLAAVGDRRGVGAADRLCEACVVLFGVDAAAISLVFDGTNVGTLGASGVSAPTQPICSGSGARAYGAGAKPRRGPSSIRAPTLTSTTP
jgi:hypothetical protein